MAGIVDEIKKFFSRHPGVTQFLKDLAFSLVIVAIIALLLYAYAGVWTPVVSVSGVSMLPHMHTGDLALVQGLDRTAIHTANASLQDGYSTFDGFGDVVVYYPNGDRTRPMVIHRAMYWVNQSEPMYPDGRLAPWSGYITQGDNRVTNFETDQQAGICDGPVKVEWVHGVVKYKVPYLGYLRALV